MLVPPLKFYLLDFVNIRQSVECLIISYHINILFGNISHVQSLNHMYLNFVHISKYDSIIM